MLIGILQCGHSPAELQPHVGDYPAMFERLLDGHGFEFRTWAVCDMEFPNSVDAADGWLITGSRHGAYEPHPWIPPLEAFIRDCFGAEVPMVGICFGHQIIAQALGGTVEKFKDGWAVGPATYAFDGHGDLTINAWHQDQVTARPDGARRVASHPFCENAALLYDGRALTVQAHPEYGADFIAGLIETRGPGVVPPDLLARARDTLSTPTDTARLAAIIARFFKDRTYG